MPYTRPHGMIALIGFLAATYLVAGVSTVFTVTSIMTWYAGLAKPSFNPPNQIFGPVWTVLYALMAIAGWMIWKRADSELRSRALLLFWVQLGLNFGWTLIFFRGHQIGLALVEILLLWLAILGTTVLFFRLRNAAGWMFVPYLAWVSFASVLNFAIWMKN
jgi:tryptophan-rich sensory protein